MAKLFKVWIEIEEYDEETDESIDHVPPFAATAQFDTLEEAELFAEEMHETYTNRMLVEEQEEAP